MSKRIVLPKNDLVFVEQMELLNKLYDRSVAKGYHNLRRKSFVVELAQESVAKTQFGINDSTDMFSFTTVDINGDVGTVSILLLEMGLLFSMRNKEWKPFIFYEDIEYIEHKHSRFIFSSLVIKSKFDRVKISGNIKGAKTLYDRLSFLNKYKD